MSGFPDWLFWNSRLDQSHVPDWPFWKSRLVVLEFQTGPVWISRLDGLVRLTNQSGFLDWIPRDRMAGTRADDPLPIAPAIGLGIASERIDHCGCSGRQLERGAILFSPNFSRSGRSHPCRCQRSTRR